MLIKKKDMGLNNEKRWAKGERHPLPSVGGCGNGLSPGSKVEHWHRRSLPSQRQYGVVVKSMGSGTRCPGFKSQTNCYLCDFEQVIYFLCAALVLPLM